MTSKSRIKMNSDCFLLLLTLLVCTNICLSKVSATAESKTKSGVSQSNSTHRIIEVNGHGREKLKFTDLYEDIYHIIFSFISFDKFPELVHMAEINSKCAETLNSIFRRKYHNHMFGLDYHIPDGLVEYSDYEMRLKIYYYDLVKKTLKYFGNSIRKLEIDNGFDYRNHTEDSKIVHRLANEYCKSLIQLELGQIKGDTFAQFERPFSTVESLRFRYYVNQIGPIPLPFNQLFPSLKRMDVVISDVDISYIDCEHLEHMRIYMACNRWETVEQIADLIKKNPTIKSIETVDFPKYLHDVINEFLPNLESITLNSIRNETVHFDNVRHLCLSHSRVSFNLLDMITFSNLESFEVHISASKHLRPIRAFFKRNRNVRRLSIGIENLLGRIDDQDLYDHLHDLFLELPNLVELKIRFLYSVDTDFIIALNELSNNLTRFEFAVRNYSKLNLKSIRQRFENEWHIIEIEPDQQFRHHEGLVLEKKNATILVLNQTTNEI